MHCLKFLLGYKCLIGKKLARGQCDGDKGSE